ncbi:MAG: metallophosphoesterase [Sphingomicrobium sp.]
MTRAVLRRVGLALVGLVWCVALSAQPANPQRIVAVGDLHGDFDAWRAIALKARLIDRRDHWSGGSTTLVQTGDIVDRGPDSRKIIHHLMKLQREAPKAGGKVVVLVGNHEAMNMTDDLRYVDPGEFAAFATPRSARLRERAFDDNRATIVAAFRAISPTMAPEAIHQAWLAQTPLGKVEHQAAWSPRGELGRWTIANRAVARIGGTLFVHGGISVRYAGFRIDEINRRITAALTIANGADDSILYDPFGPLWYRGLVTRTADAADQPAALPPAAGAAPAAPYPSIDDELTTVLRSFGARRLVIAHTPDLRGIEISHGGRMVRIDTGISRFYGGKLSYLEIIGERLVPHDFDRSIAARPAPVRP